MKKRGEFKRIAREIGELVEQKNAAYGSSFANAPRILAVLFPDGIRTSQYADVLLIARILDKLQRIATDKDALGESPYRDIAGYGLLGEWLRQMLKGDQADAASVPVRVRQVGEASEPQVRDEGVSPGDRGGRAELTAEPLRQAAVPDVPTQPHWSPAWQAGQDNVCVVEENLHARAARKAEEVSAPLSGSRRWHEITSTEDAYAVAREMERVARPMDDALELIARAEAARFDLMRHAGDGVVVMAATGKDGLWRVFAGGQQLSTYGWHTADPNTYKAGGRGGSDAQFDTYPITFAHQRRL